MEEFADLLHQTVTVEPFSGNDGYGERSYGAAVSYESRVVGKRKLVRDANGVERVSSYTVYLNTTTQIDPRSRVTLPAGYTPQQPLIVAVGFYPDETELHHTTLFLA